MPSARRGRPAPARLLAVFAVAAAVGLLMPSIASAGTPPATTATSSTDPRITLQAQDPWTPVGGTATFRIDITNAPPGATLTFTTAANFGAMISRVGDIGIL